MAFTYDITTNRGKVRRALGDTVETQPFLDDAEVDEALTMAGGDVTRACGIALEWAIATATRQAAIYATPNDGEAVPDAAARLAGLQALRAIYGGTESADTLATVSRTGVSPSDPCTLYGGRAYPRCGC